MVKWINCVQFEGKIEDVEKTLNIKIPVELAAIIEKYNKGMPRPNKIPLGNGKFAEFTELISFNKDESVTVYNSQNEIMKANGIIPFGFTANENFICLKNGNVILYDVEYNAEKHIADSFQSFINMLQ